MMMLNIGYGNCSENIKVGHCGVQYVANINGNFQIMHFPLCRGYQHIIPQLAEDYLYMFSTEERR